MTFFLPFFSRILLWSDRDWHRRSDEGGGCDVGVVVFVLVVQQFDVCVLLCLWYFVMVVCGLWVEVRQGVVGYTAGEAIVFGTWVVAPYGRND